MMKTIKNDRVMRALTNFDTGYHYEHEVILSEQKRLDNQRAYEWAIEKFGDPGTTWDFYFREDNMKQHSHNVISKRWSDIFGFHDEKLAAIFILRWL